MADMTDREILDEVTLLLAKATEAKNGTARSRDGDLLDGFVLEQHTYMRMHCLLNLVARDFSMAAIGRLTRQTSITTGAPRRSARAKVGMLTASETPPRTCWSHTSTTNLLTSR